MALADYTVKPTAPAANLLLLGRTSSDAYKTYTGLIECGQESLTPELELPGSVKDQR